ncbi:hypothetical protein KP509_10G062700 [Ceratopteris richardii]|uniref:Cyclin-like domain-containing protein n=1 Tax=Ceratopteris richardii TaxID=49495 RepID=A0A8T2TZM3_CERRI|nr:hypothetical protein KP509_10G062700 [Ceratopteris richardii]
MDFEHSLLCCEEYINSPLTSDIADATSTSSTPSSTASVVSSPSYWTMPAFFPDDDELTIPFLMSKQKDYEPDEGYAPQLQSNQTLCEARSNAARWMTKAHVSHKFSPLTIAMAMNYLDRYLQRNLSLPWKPWMMELLSVACLSLAAKMEEVDVPALLDLQIEGLEHLFQTKTVQRMELNVLSAIRWRLRCVTSFTFVEKAINYLKIRQDMKSGLMMRIVELIFGSLADVDFLSIDSSTIAAASVCFAVEELLPRQAAELKLCLLEYIPTDEEKLRKCSMLLESVIVDPVHITTPSKGNTKFPLSPTTVLLPYDDNSSMDNSRDLCFHLAFADRELDLEDECAFHPKKQRRI